MFKEWGLSKIKELQNQINQDHNRILDVKLELPDTKFNRCYFDLYIQMNQLRKEKIEKEIKRIYNLLYRYNHLKNPKTTKSDFDLQKIKLIPIENLFDFDRLKQGGSRSRAFCPFHDGHTPSFDIYHEDNHYHCFGCGEHGDNITFIQKLNNMTFKEACSYLCSSPNP